MPECFVIAMPIRAKSPCISPSCRELVTSPGYCQTHKKQKQKVSDLERGSSASRGYGYRWRLARSAYLCEHPLCKHCSDIGIISAATVVDHVIPHKNDKTMFWQISNWQSLCESCHNKKTATQDGGFGRK